MTSEVTEERERWWQKAVCHTIGHASLFARWFYWPQRVCGRVYFGKE